jgi:ubiquinone/menaquinone biosynthesis C-methylase UbiE
MPESKRLRLLDFFKVTLIMPFQYDQSDIYSHYDESRKLPSETIRVWLEAIGRYVPKEAGQTILDVGCGTGRFTESLAQYFSTRIIGIDLSIKMLATARENLFDPMIELIQGSAENIPLADKQIGLVFLSMVFHHFQNKEKAIHEFTRVLKPGGFLCIRNSMKEALDSYMWMRFFPQARQIEFERAPARNSLKELLRASGAKLMAHEIIQQYYAKDLAEYFEKLSLRGISSLKAIPDDEFKQGLGDFEHHCREKDTGKPVYEEIDLFVFSLA